MLALFRSLRQPGLVFGLATVSLILGYLSRFRVSARWVVGNTTCHPCLLMADRRASEMRGSGVGSCLDARLFKYLLDVLVQRRCKEFTLFALRCLPPPPFFHFKPLFVVQTNLIPCRDERWVCWHASASGTCAVSLVQKIENAKTIQL